MKLFMLKELINKSQSEILHLGSALVGGAYMQVEQEVGVTDSGTFSSENSSVG